MGKLSGKTITATVTDGYIHIILPKIGGGFSSWRFKLDDLNLFVKAANYAALPATGAANKLYITLDDYSLYIWDDGDYKPIGGGSSITDINQLTDNSELLKWGNDIKYGHLFNWHALSNIVNPAYPDFHVPTDTDFETLFTELGGASIAGGKLKETGLIFWDTPNTGATNEVGFNLRGNGERQDDGTFYGINEYGYLWASTEDSPDAYSIYTYNSTIIASLETNDKNYGFGVRLVNNDSTLADGDQGIYIGNDGREYKTICIRGQEWLSENLAETLNASGVSIPNITDNSAWAVLTSPGRCSYNNDDTLVFGGIRPKLNKKVDAKYIDNIPSSFDMAAAIHAATNKPTPIDADEVGIWNSITGLLNRLSWANIKATLKAYFDGLYTNHATLSNLLWTASGHISGVLEQRVACFDGANLPYLCETTETNFYVGDFTGAYAGLATETNWVDNATSLVPGTFGDRAIGIGNSGSIYECFYSQFGWVRDYINPYITNATLIAALQTLGNWTFLTDAISYYTGTIGDRGQKYYANGIAYECVNGTTHLWLKIGNLNAIEVSDVTYMAKPQIAVGKGMGDIIIIPEKHDILFIVAESETTTAGNITIGRTATAEVSILSVTSACSVNGNAQVVLDGVTFNVALTTAQNTATLVATALRAATYVSGNQVWTTGGATTTVTFTSNKYKAATDSTYDANGTGANGTMTTSVQGVNPNNDVVTSTALATVIGAKKNLTVIKSVDYPTTSAQNIYINIDSAATVKLNMIIIKLYE